MLLSVGMDDAGDLRSNFDFDCDDFALSNYSDGVRDKFGVSTVASVVCGRAVRFGGVVSDLSSILLLALMDSFLIAVVDDWDREGIGWCCRVDFLIVADDWDREGIGWCCYVDGCFDVLDDGILVFCEVMSFADVACS